MAEETTQIIRIVIDSSKAVDGSRAVTQALERMEKSQVAAGSTLERMEASLGRVGGYLKAQISLHVAELGVRLGEMARQAFEAAAGLDELAEQLGTNARALQGMQYEAAQYGVKSEQLETALSKFSQKMGEAANGSKDMVEALQALGVKNLDVQGKLRPTESLMQDVAKAIVSIDDPAKRSAAAVDFFGKSGTRMLPLLVEMAKGLDQMAASAERAGAMIGPQTIERLDKLSDRMEVNKLKWRAHTAEVLGSIAELGDGFNEWVYKIEASLNASFQSADEWARKFQESLATGAARGAAMFMEAFRALPDQLGKLFTDAFNKALEAVETGLNSIASGIANSWMGKTLGLDGTGVNLGRLNGGGASFGDYTGKIGSAGDAAARRMAEQFAQERATADAYAAADAQSRLVSDLPRRSTYKPGAGTSGVKGAGGAEADAIAKAIRDTERETAAQLAYAEASEKGAKAVADLETHFKALKAAQDAYGKTADQNKAGVEALTQQLEKMMDAADRAKNLKDFNLGTETLEKSNELLEAENRLMNESVEVRAREIALIRVRQEAEAKGLSMSVEKEREAIERRQEAVTQNERLKAQGEEMKRTNELWLAPLKSGLESIQRTGADMWEQLLENGKFSAEEFGQIFAKMARRAAAELLALATIRPVIQVALEAVGGLGLVSPGTASALGYGGGIGNSFPGMGGVGGMSGVSGGGGGMGGIGGFGGLSGLSGSLGSFGTWLNTPFIGGMSGVSPLPAGAFGPAPNIAGGGLTPLGAFAGVASMGMGAYNLFTSKSTAGKIGGGMGMLGGAMGMMGALMPAMSALGPIGMGIGLVGSLLPMLFGGDKPEVPPMPPLDYGAGVIWPTGTGFGYSGNSLNGGKGMSAGAESIGTSLQSLFARGGLKAISGSLIGGDIASGVNNSWNGQSWQGTPYTQIGLHVPGSGYERVTYNDTSRTAEQAADLLIAEMWKANVLRGGVSGASESLKTATSTSNPTTAKAVQDLVDFVSIYDKLGKTTNATADALKAIDEKFATLTESATRYGLSLDPINKAMGDEKTKVATDFADTIDRAWKQLKDPQLLAVQDLDKERDALLKTNQEILDAKIGGTDQALTIEKIYWEKRNQIAQQGVSADWNAAGNAAFNQLQASKAFQGTLAGYKQQTNLIGQSPMAQTMVGWNNEASQFMLATESQFGIGSQEYYQATVAAAQKVAALTKQASKDFIDGLHDMVAALDSDGAGNMARLMKQRAADIATATALDGPGYDGLWAIGKNVKEAMKAWNAQIFKVADDFSFSISQGLLEFTNPLQAQINALNKQRDEAVKTAKANNDAVGQIYGEYATRAGRLDEIRINNMWSVKEIRGHAEEAGRALTEIEQQRITSLTAEADLAKQVADEVNQELASLGSHYTSISDVTELFLKKEQQLREQYYAQALSGLEDLIKRITIGDLSGASSLTVLSGTQASYEAIRAQAFAGDVTARQNFSQSAGEYLTAGRDYYAYSPDYFAIRDQIKADIEALTVQIKGGTAGSGAPVSADVQALTQQLDRARADNDNLRRTVDQLVASQAMTNDLLQRIVANQRP